jgi:hypothetical protein
VEFRRLSLRWPSSRLTPHRHRRPELQRGSRTSSQQGSIAPANNLGQWPTSLGCTTNSYSSTDLVCAWNRGVGMMQSITWHGSEGPQHLVFHGDPHPECAVTTFAVCGRSARRGRGRDLDRGPELLLFGNPCNSARRISLATALDDVLQSSCLQQLLGSALRSKFCLQRVDPGTSRDELSSLAGAQAPRSPRSIRSGFRQL